MYPLGRAYLEYRLLLVAVTLGYSRVFFVSRGAQKACGLPATGPGFPGLSAYPSAR